MPFIVSPFSEAAVPSARLASRFLQVLASNTAKSSDSVFKCLTAPPIELEAYARRLGQFLHCSAESFVCAAVIADRLFCADPSLFCDLSIHKILLATAVVGLKFSDDKFFTNRYYAEVGGVSTQEMNELELAILKTLNFSVFVNQDAYQMAATALAGLARRDYLTTKVSPRPALRAVPEDELAVTTIV